MKPHVELVTCRKPTAKVAEERAVVWGRPSVAVRSVTRSVAWHFASVLVVAVAILMPRFPVADAATGRVRAELSDFTIRLDPAAIKAGQIRFDVHNASPTNVHEMIVAATALAPTDLPYQPASDRVDESKLRTVGEVSDIRPGGSGTLTLRLKPGRYAVLCNEVGHYKAGMVTVLTVTR